MWLELSRWQIALLNVLGIPAAHLLISWWVTQWPTPLVERLLRFLPIPRSEAAIHRLVGVRRWKRLLPDAAGWFGGVSKGELPAIFAKDDNGLKAFRVEAGRGEFAHWLQLAVISSFVIWTPGAGAWVIVAYAGLSNLPCLLSLRSLRLRLDKLINAKSCPDR
ncbi:MAG: hypothetical protein Q7Q71_14630 [Verrucomicrobiota bacterium JB023]|nr:hypothetical protein [Verrucomicrobiota bacterium JB023]